MIVLCFGHLQVDSIAAAEALELPMAAAKATSPIKKPAVRMEAKVIIVFSTQITSFVFQKSHLDFGKRRISFFRRYTDETAQQDR